MLSEDEIEALGQEWRRIHRELEGLARGSTRSEVEAIWVEPSSREAVLLKRLDQIEFALGENNMLRRRKQQVKLQGFSRRGIFPGNT